MKLTVLGCSGSGPGPDSPASGYLVEAEGYSLVLDMGNGSFGALQRHVAPHEVGAVVLSHLHPDHCIDLTAYLVVLRWAPTRPTRRIPVYGPAGTNDRIASAYDPMQRKMGLHELFDFAAPSGKPVELGPFTVTFAPANHPVPAYSIRVEHAGRSLVYSGDTGESEPLVELARDADALLCEASFAATDEYMPNLHLTGRQAGEIASRAGVKKLIVTHVPAWNSRDEAVAEARSAFDGEVVAAAPDASYDI